MVSKIGVFVTAETNSHFPYLFSTYGLQNLITIYNDIDQFRSSTHSYKLACLLMSFPDQIEFNTLIDQLANIANHVLILMNELHKKNVQIVQQHDNPRVSYFICGEFNFNLTHSPVHKFYNWFTTSVHFYKHVRPHTLDVLNPYAVKPKYFDALLGRKKYHRDIAYEYFLQYPNKNIMTYFKDFDCDFRDTDEEYWIWEKDGLDINKTVEWTVDQLSYYGYRMHLSQIVPLKIYNQTAYSLIAETNYDNHYNFYTEKTVKPILGRRLFITLSGKDSLNNLQRIGFKTFNGIIDETYDTIDDNDKRFESALDQVRWLMEQPQQEILDKIKPICEHNFIHMLTTDWHDVYFKTEFVNYFQTPSNVV